MKLIISTGCSMTKNNIWGAKCQDSYNWKVQIVLILNKYNNIGLKIAIRSINCMY